MRAGNFFPLLINVQTDFFDHGRLVLPVFPALGFMRFVLNGDRLDLVRLILPGNPDEPTSHAIHIVASQTKDMGQT